VAVPAYAGIPVTHRKYTSTVTIITGNEDPDKNESSVAWSKISTGAGTLVFLMGIGNLPGIARKLMEHGRSPETPVALIRWGTRSEQKTLVGTLHNIASLAEENNFQNPAVIVVGEVVKLREKLRWFENKPLFGRRILVTRAREQASALSDKIAALGGEPVEFPVISIAPLDDYSALDRAIQNISSYHWVIFTSVNGVHAFFDRLELLNRDIRDLHGVKICAIGPQTEKALRSLALRVDYVPGNYQAEDIITGLKDKISPGDRILLPRAAVARNLLPESLAALGALVDVVAAYKTVAGSGDAPLIRSMLLNGEIDVITFTSSSTVQNFLSLIGAKQPAGLTGRALVACIGPITAQTAADAGLRVDVVAKEYTIDGLLQAILDHLHMACARQK